MLKKNKTLLSILSLFLLIFSCSDSKNNIINPNINNTNREISIDNKKVDNKSQNKATIVKFYDLTDCGDFSHNFQIDLNDLAIGEHSNYFFTDAETDNYVYGNTYVSGKYITGTYYTDQHKVDILYLGDSEKIFLCSQSSEPYANGNIPWEPIVSNKKVSSFAYPDEDDYPRYVWVKTKWIKTTIPNLEITKFNGPKILHGLPSKEQDYEATGLWSVDVNGGNEHEPYYYKWYYTLNQYGNWILGKEGSGTQYAYFSHRVTGYGKRKIKCTVESYDGQSDSKSIEIFIGR